MKTERVVEQACSAVAFSGAKLTPINRAQMVSQRKQECR
jgi:hypothetical protein